jgi:hypothetical protein
MPLMSMPTCGTVRREVMRTLTAVPTAPAGLPRAGLGADVTGTGGKREGARAYSPDSPTTHPGAYDNNTYEITVTIVVAA